MEDKYLNLNAIRVFCLWRIENRLTDLGIKYLLIPNCYICVLHFSIIKYTQK